jgi:cytochrome c551/c552/glucose/arabinose dehydrogenase
MNRILTIQTRLPRVRPSFLLIAALLIGSLPVATAQESPKEEDFSKILKISAPEDALLEVGGLAVMPDGNLGVATRRGDVFIVENPTSARPYFRRFATGLHEVLGLSYQDGAFYCAQRGELTKLVDTDSDGQADVYETVYAWPLSGHYHEYSFGPKVAPDGSFFVSGNVAFGNEEWWRGESRVPWRGWIMRISPEGTMEPWATGMRSPAGLGMIDGELFYTENQGDWMGSGGIWHVEKGIFSGHPAGLRWTNRPESPLDLRTEQLYAQVDQRQVRNEAGNYVKPENRVDEDYKTMFEVKEEFPTLRTPAVWLPHGILGISNSELVKIPEGTFGPFAGQLLVGDQGQSKIMRVVMEKVKGEYQGVAFDFRQGFRSGVLRMAWAPDGSLFVGETNRGWGSAGEANEGLQRLVWSGRVPFEMRNVRATPDGFEVEFTQPVDPTSAEDLASYEVESFTYKYQPVYGSPPVNNLRGNVMGVRVSDDGMKVRLVLDSLRQHYIHRLTLRGLRSKDNFYSLVHPTAYYTLNNIPDGKKLTSDEFTARAPDTPSASTVKEKPTTATQQPALTTPDDPQNTSREPSDAVAVVSEGEINELLSKHTCTACHNAKTRQVGPAYADVAKRQYSDEKIVELIYNPQPQNWPDYTPMPPMAQVPQEDAQKIAAWINSLDE